MKTDYEKTILSLTLRNTLYQALVNYSKFKLLLDSDVNLLCGIQDRICPICSQMKSDGLMVPISMDGNFQLKRFNQSFDSSAVDPCAEIVNSLWKANHDVVTSEYNNRRRLTTNATDSYCEGWKSLSKTGSKNIFVPTTGVFAAICSRHDFVLGLMDMQTTGEKIGYPLSILNQVKKTYGTNICIAYDVSCKLGKAIEYTKKVSDLKEAPLTIGAFYIYDHEASCQAQYHSKVISNLGLIDSEGCERFWSFMSPFVIPTRYMTEFNRHLFLNLLVNHYHEQKLKALGYNVQLLQEEWNEYANSLRQTASSVLRSRRLDETDKVCYAVLAYDFINKLMHTRRTGHKRAITRTTQLSKALKKVTTAVNNYNRTVNESEDMYYNESRYTILYSAGLLIRLCALIDSLKDTEDIEKQGLVVLLLPEEEIVEVNRVITVATVASVFVESQSGIDDDCDSSEDDNDDDEDEDDGNDELETIAALLEEQVNSDTNNN
ncbi:hypothetical protein BDC45DRAFT_610967 [Circinella umbellata]|nr:hypothetical protein BDC45DRAFT_610967 [Circinella umbellata]